LYGADAAADLLHTTSVAAIGPVTAEAAAQLGIECSIVPSHYTIEALCAAIVKHVESSVASQAPER
jgi:uroporphyrinogen-III synthase